MPGHDEGDGDVTGAGLNSASELASPCFSAQVLRPDAVSSSSLNNAQPISSIVDAPAAIGPASRSMRSCQRPASSLRVATLTTGQVASP